MLALVKLVLVCVMFVLLVMVLFVAKVHQFPDSLYLHVAFMVSAVLLSLHMMYRLGVGHILFCVFVGAGPVWYGAWFGAVCVVNVYVVLVQLHPSVRFTLQ